MQTMEITLTIDSPHSSAAADELEVQVPYSMLLAGFKIAFLVPNAIDEKLRSLLRPVIEADPLPFKTDCIEEWLISLRDRDLDLRDASCRLRVRWV